MSPVSNIKKIIVRFTVTFYALLMLICMFWCICTYSTKLTFITWVLFNLMCANLRLHILWINCSCV